jgi:hypothetical protein
LGCTGVLGIMRGLLRKWYLINRDAVEQSGKTSREPPSISPSNRDKWFYWSALRYVATRQYRRNEAENTKNIEDAEDVGYHAAGCGCEIHVEWGRMPEKAGLSVPGNL